eukprot:3118678-Karenia_brevis.AAC.1
MVWNVHWSDSSADQAAHIFAQMRADLRKAEKDPLNHIVFLLGDFNVQLNCCDVVPLAGVCGAKAGFKGEH